MRTTNPSICRYVFSAIAGLRLGGWCFASGRPHNQRFLRTPRSKAFTLLELLVVIVILGLLAAIGIPAIRGMSKSNSMAAADRQMLDDLAYARQRAIADHTTVYVVFIPPWIIDQSQFPVTDPTIGPAITRLYGGQYTTYALLSLRMIGDQPGRSTPRYLTSWRTLPEGVFIHSNKFLIDFRTPLYPYEVTNFPTMNFPFPFVTNNAVPPYATPGGVSPVLPYVAFDYLGHLVSQRDETIPLVHGSIFYARAANGDFINQPPDVLEKPGTNTVYSANYPSNSFNQIHIDWLTGRARVEKLEIQ